ncbi:MAG: HPr(Ser) kinase/phosphatase [Candidatus Cloacimonas sp. 4484_209]|nr:MAG: HPr(Ser) kinase/phosphatase [Candidatus Cloacimonas sp. 4484_209]
MKVMRDKVTVKDLYTDKREELKLKLVGGSEGLEREIKTNYLSRPGLLFTGFKLHFNAEAVQILGPQNISYLEKLSVKERNKAVEMLLSYKEIPCIIISDKLTIPEILIKSCNSSKIPLFSTKIKRCDIVHQIYDYLETKKAPYVYVHGTLVDVYGIGVLFTGKSGIGKSETALDLVARGHRLVADDVVKITRMTPGYILMGEGKEPVSFFHSHLEIRGLGVIDLSKIFGVRATRLHKRVEVEVNLVKWGEKKNIDRTGLEGKTKTILGVKIPLKIIPLVTGKNISVLSEMVALEHLLKIYGYNTPVIFNKRLLEMLRKRGEKLAHLDGDVE